MSDLEDLCRALDEVVRPLPTTVGDLQQRAARLRVLAAHVQDAARHATEGPDCSRVVQGLYDAAASIEAAGRALTAAAEQGRAYIQRTVFGSVAAAIGAVAVVGAIDDRDGSDAPGTGTAPETSQPAAPLRAPGGAPPGFFMVPLSLIDDADSTVHGPEAFGKGYSPEDLTWAYSALYETVLPAMAAGKGADYFAELDQQMGLVGTRSYSDTYSGFFSLNEGIRLNRTAGGYRVANGYHRIWVARQLGLEEIPVSIGG